jgi:membrane protein DedA with SNARE-associated domain
MQVIAAASSTPSYGAWAYLAVFALMALSFAGIPAIGGVVVGWAAVLASQGKLNIVAVMIVAALGPEAGGLAGYSIGERWGRRLLERLGRWRKRRQQAVATAEAVYAKWGASRRFLHLHHDLWRAEDEILPVRPVELRCRRRIRAVGGSSRVRRWQGLG